MTLADAWVIPTTINQARWQVAPSPVPTCPPHGLHIWLWSQGQARVCVDELRPCLSDNERERATRFYTEDLRQRYVVRWGGLRHILSRYLAIAPHEIAFKYGERGKPYLTDDALHFNLSHSEDFAIVGVSSTSAIGIDIEGMVSLPDLAVVAKHHFSPLEQRTLFSLPAAEQVAGFYNCWTRKEAFIKVDGRGLAIPLDSFDVTLKPDDRPRIARIGDNMDVDAKWTLLDLPVPDGYKGAVAAHQVIEQVQLWILKF